MQHTLTHRIDFPITLVTLADIRSVALAEGAPADARVTIKSGISSVRGDRPVTSVTVTWDTAPAEDHEYVEEVPAGADD